MGEWYVVYKKIKGRLYAYRQKTYRLHQQVKTVSEYIGSADHLAPVIQKRELGQTQLTLQGHPALALQVPSEEEALTLWAEGKLTEWGGRESLELYGRSWFQKNHGHDLLPRSAEALREYSKAGANIGHLVINAALRGLDGAELDTNTREAIRYIKAALYDRRSCLTTNVALYRGGHLPVSKARIGERFTDPAILSFACSHQTAIEFVPGHAKGLIPCMFKLIAQKGDSRYLPLYGTEDEVITSGGVFEIVGLSMQTWPHSALEVTIVKVENFV